MRLSTPNLQNAHHVLVVSEPTQPHINQLTGNGIRWAVPYRLTIDFSYGLLPKELFREHKGNPPQTLTEVYTALTNTLLQHHEQKTKEKMKTPVGMPNTECHDLLKKHWWAQFRILLVWLVHCTRGMITQSVRDEIQQRVDLITKRKNEVLINAAETQVTTDPAMFQVFMEILKEEPSLSTIVERMNVSTLTSSKMTCFESRSSTTLSQLQSVARLAYQGTQNDQLIFHDVQDSIESLEGATSVLDSSPKASYNFIHKTLQEFLTACSTLWSVNLNNCGLTYERMRMLFFVKDGKAFDHITNFNVSDKTITASTASLLGMMLKENNTLKKLNLQLCKLQPEGLEEVIKGMILKENNTLKKLDLHHCGLQPEGLEDVIKGVQVNSKLETLVLSYNTIDSTRASCLGMMLKENNTLKKLDFEECELQPEGLDKVIKGVQVNIMLETLDLLGYTIDDETASCLETQQVVVIVLRLVIVEEYQVRLKKTPESKHNMVPRLTTGY
eukprot:Em0012g629a